MKTSTFDYELDPGRIAQKPVEPRDASRLLVLNRADGSIVHRHFRDIGDYLSSDDLLVCNDSRVIPARLFAYKLQPPRPGEAEPQRGGRVELLLLNQQENGHWHALVKGKRVRVGTRLALVEPENGILTRPLSLSERTETPAGPAGSARSGEPCWAGIEATVVGMGERGERLIAFDPPLDTDTALERVGTVPLPPYIHAKLEDPERYQTVYARWPGSAAAPTAGLHFTAELLLDLRQRGVQFDFVTLHIGLDTFRPVSTERIEDHSMHTEFVTLGTQTAERINQARLAGRRVVAVGTTVVRVLESAAQATACEGACAWQTVAAYEGPTDLFIMPGYRFKVVDRLVTNFHLPRSTLLMLVSAFAGLDLTRRAYQAAIDNGYRFYSFGDAMLIL